MSGAAPGRNLRLAISFSTDFFFAPISCLGTCVARRRSRRTLVRCLLGPISAASRVSFITHTPCCMQVRGAKGAGMPPKCSFFHPTLHCYSGVAGRRVEQPCRVSFASDLFLFPQVWRADESTGFVAWAFAAGRSDILELNSSLAQRTGSTRVAKEAHDERSLKRRRRSHRGHPSSRRQTRLPNSRSIAVNSRLSSLPRSRRQTP